MTVPNPAAITPATTAKPAAPATDDILAAACRALGQLAARSPDRRASDDLPGQLAAAGTDPADIALIAGHLAAHPAS